jgi:hypothetical protein
MKYFKYLEVTTDTGKLLKRKIFDFDLKQFRATLYKKAEKAYQWFSK